MFAGTVGSIDDTANPNSSAANFSATLVLNGVSYDGTVSGDNGIYSVAVANVGPLQMSQNGSVGTLTVTEEGQSAVDAPVPVTVTDAPLSAYNGADFLTTPGAPTTVIVATFTDSDPTYEGPANYSAMIDWGDGQSAGSIALVSQNSDGSWTYSVTGTHTYSVGGSFTVTTIVQDSSGSYGGGTPASASATCTATVVQVQSITVADGAGSGDPIPETGMSSDQLLYTLNEDGTGSVILSSVVVPSTSDGYAATLYELIDPSTGVVGSGQLAAQMNISIPAPADGAADTFTLEAGTNINGAFSATQSIQVAPLKPKLAYANPGGPGTNPAPDVRLTVNRPGGKIGDQGITAMDQNGQTHPLNFTATTSSGAAAPGITVTSGGPDGRGVENPNVNIAPGVPAGDYNIVATSPDLPGNSLSIFIKIP
jgi:hypothetical protein